MRGWHRGSFVCEALVLLGRGLFLWPSSIFLLNIAREQTSEVSEIPLKARYHPSSLRESPRFLEKTHGPAVKERRARKNELNRSGTCPGVGGRIQNLGQKVLLPFAQR